MSDLSQIPAMQPPAGQVSNFTNPVDISHITRNGIYVMVPLLSVFVLARIGSRLKLKRALGWDDLLCIIAAASIYAWTGVMLLILGNPMGRHMWDIPITVFLSNSALERITITLILQLVAAMFVRLSLLALYLHIFKPIVWARVMIWAATACVAIFYITCTMLVIIKMVPRPGQTWLSVSLVNGQGKLEQNVNVAQGYFGMISDLIILAIPLKLIHGLTMDRNRKIGLVAVFSVGLLAVGSSVAGFVSRVNVDINDATWTGSITDLFVILELGIGLICGCVPVTTVLLKTLVEKMVKSWTSMRNYSASLLSRSEDAQKTKSYQKHLPQIPSATIDGIRTFIRRLHRSDAQETAFPVTEMSAFSKLDSIDEGYHEQLRAINSVDLEHFAAQRQASSAPASRGRDI